MYYQRECREFFALSKGIIKAAVSGRWYLE